MRDFLLAVLGTVSAVITGAPIAAVILAIIAAAAKESIRKEDKERGNN